MVTGAGRLQWVFPASIGASQTLVENIIYARGLLVVAPASRYIPEFEDYWVRINESSPSPDDPWFQTWYMGVELCRLPGVTEEPYVNYRDCVLYSEAEKRSAYQQDQYVEPAITALYTYARALRSARMDHCGADTRGACDSLITMSYHHFLINYLLTTDFTFGNDERIPSLASSSISPYNKPKLVKFDDNGDLVSAAFDIWNYNDATVSFSYTKVSYLIRSLVSGSSYILTRV